MPRQARRGQKYTKRVRSDGSQETGRVPCLAMLLIVAAAVFDVIMVPAALLRWLT